METINKISDTEIEIVDAITTIKREIVKKEVIEKKIADLQNLLSEFE